MNEKDILFKDTCVDSSYGTLHELAEVIRYIDEKQIMTCIFEMGWTEEKIQKFIDAIGIYHAKLRYESNSLKEFSKNFNRKYATDNNKCFNTAERMFSEIQGTLKNSIRVFLKFTKQINARKAFNIRDRKRIPVYRISNLFEKYRQQYFSFFDSDYVAPIVKQLCNVLLNFFADIREVMLLCKKVIRKEASIRKNPTKCRQIFEECYNDVEKFTRTFVKELKDNKDYQINDPMVKELNETSETDNCIAEWFHKKSESEFTTFVIQDKLYKAKNQGISPKETLLWKNDYGKISKVRKVIEYFDEMMPKGQYDKTTEKHKLDGKMMAMLTYWAIGDDGEKKLFHKYFSETYKGCYQTIHYKTLCSSYSEIKNNEKTNIIMKFENFYNKFRTKKEKIA